MYDSVMSNKIRDTDLKSIADTYNMVIQRSDKRRLDFSGLLIAIYTPVSSGLAFVALSVTLASKAEKLAFLATAISSVLIIFCALAERLGYFLIAQTQAKKYIGHVKETGGHFNEPLVGDRWQLKLVTYQIPLQIILLCVNLLSILTLITIAVCGS